MRKIFNFQFSRLDSTRQAIFNYKFGVTNFSSLSFCLICLICLIGPISPSYAQEATPTATVPSPQKDQLEKIRNLKERVAETVAEQRKKNRRAYFGKIKEISDSTIILTTKKEEVSIIIAEETNIYKVDVGAKKEIDLEDLEENQSITALGFLENEELTSRIIIAKQKPVIIHGKVTEVDLEDFTITVKTKKEGEFIVDYEKTTECKIFEKGESLTKGGLSKIKVDDRIHVVGTESAKEDSRLTALRILVLPGKALGVVGKEETTAETD